MRGLDWLKYIVFIGQIPGKMNKYLNNEGQECKTCQGLGTSERGRG
jgi:hypothetical protein